MEPNIDQKTLQTIEKLFRLSESSNENEANVAMKKAMSLLAQHNLSQSQFNNLKKAEDEIGISFVQEGKNFITWRSILFNSICKSHFCKVIAFSSTGKYGVIGKSINRDAVVISYRYLCRVIEQESLNALLKYKTNEHGKKFCNSFKIGMFRYLVLLWLGFGAHALNAQDQIFLRNGDGVMECIILESNDSVIVFRTLDPTDLHEYEISVSAIYGFLLEDPSRGSMVAAPVNYLMEFQHTRKKRKPMFKEGNTILFRQWGDSSEMPRSARIIEIHQDSIQLELKTRRVPERLWFRWSAFQSFGYKTVFTESMTLSLAPVS